MGRLWPPCLLEAAQENRGAELAPVVRVGYHLTLGTPEQDHRPIARLVPIKTVMPLSMLIEFVALRSEIDDAGAGAEVR